MRQGELFSAPMGAGPADPELPLLAPQLRNWQERVAAFQAPLFAPFPSGAQAGGGGQAELFQLEAAAASAWDQTRINPLDLRPQTLTFWRWPQAPQQGAALYFVVDRPPHLATALLLYVGETGRADRRWKGDHDCKGYLAAYGEALQRAALEARLTIRFWLDVPPATKARRTLEQALIRRWQPPFNKETRARWATPFQAEPT